MCRITTSLILLILSAGAASRLSMAQNPPVCGSVKRFNDTHKWQDLPGCTDKRDYDNDLSSVSLLGVAKDHFRDFFAAWEKGDYDRVESFANDCYGFVNSYTEKAWNSERELVVARPAYDEMKQTVRQYMSWVPLLNDLAQGYYNTVTRVEEAKKGNTRNSDLAETFAQQLQDTLQRATDAKVPDTLVIQGVGSAKTATIAEIREMMPSFLGQADQAVTQAKAEEDAEYAPFRRVLTGDKLNLYNQRLKRYQLYGSGGRVLKTPDQYRDSPVWCTSGVDRNAVIPRWEVDCWHFNGMTKAGEVVHRTGAGEDAPASAFR